jgi:hypothetical protein
MNKILFILKRREDFNAKTHSHIGLSTGLYNSARFMSDMMVEMGFNAKLVVVKDNNDIDREVTLFRPTHCIIEALWVVPTKFTILQKLHPTVKWIVRLHSEMPFLAGEGMAMDWVGDYSDLKNIKIACNAPRLLSEIRTYVQIRNRLSDKGVNDKIIYLPNFYPQEYKSKVFDRQTHPGTINIGCFGAIRPLKNHMVQAIAALQFAREMGLFLNFHINAGRIEMQGDANLRNLRQLFEQLAFSGHKLVNHQWCPREEFLELCATMDIGLQVSFSETFNIVGADLISQGVPLVGSSEIPWSSNFFNADPTNGNDIKNKLIRAYRTPGINTQLNKFHLTRYTNKTKEIWTNAFKE